jgi:phosphate acetyltransferase
MDVIQKIRAKAKSIRKTIALPEYDDKRVSLAAKIIEKEGIAKVILLTPDRIDKNTKENYIKELYEIRKARGVDIDSIRQLFEDPLYYAAMMTREGKVDGFVGGASHTSADMVRAAIYCLELDPRFTVATSGFIMAVPDCPYGEDGTFVFADCGVIPEPTSRQLACISILAAELLNKVLGFNPKVAMLSYSTKGSAKGKFMDKIKEAMDLLKETAPNLLVDAELQVDAAIVPEVARIKYPQGILGGRANVLIFPDLEAGNISYKLVERLARARALGPLIMGLNRPCSDLSRGCSVDDVVDCVAVTAIRAQ